MYSMVDLHNTNNRCYAFAQMRRKFLVKPNALWLFIEVANFFLIFAQSELSMTFFRQVSWYLCSVPGRFS